MSKCIGEDGRLSHNPICIWKTFPSDQLGSGQPIGVNELAVKGQALLVVQQRPTHGMSGILENIPNSLKDTFSVYCCNGTTGQGQPKLLLLLKAMIIAVVEQGKPTPTKTFCRGKTFFQKVANTSIGDGWVLEDLYLDKTKFKNQIKNVCKKYDVTSFHQDHRIPNCFNPHLLDEDATRTSFHVKGQATFWRKFWKSSSWDLKKVVDNWNAAIKTFPFSMFDEDCCPQGSPQLARVTRFDVDLDGRDTSYSIFWSNEKLLTTRKFTKRLCEAYSSYWKVIKKMVEGYRRDECIPREFWREMKTVYSKHGFVFNEKRMEKTNEAIMEAVKKEKDLQDGEQN